MSSVTDDITYGTENSFMGMRSGRNSQENSAACGIPFIPQGLKTPSFLLHAV